MTLSAALAASLLLQSLTPAQSPIADPPSVCDSCDEWNRPQAPFKLHGRSYYVGVQGLSAVLVQTSAGLILLDAGLPQSAPLIMTNIRSLGFKVADIRLILNSHAHYDHSGGIARLQRESGAVVVASPSGASALGQGRPTSDDPQFGRDGSGGAFPPVQNLRIIKDREALVLGDTTLTPHFTPGHTPGSTTWSWRSCEGTACVNIVYADSLNAISLDGYRFLGGGGAKDVSPAFKSSIATVAALPCNLMVSVHPGFSRLFEKVKLRSANPSPDPLLDSQACRAYAADAAKRLDARLEAERAGTVK